MVEFKVGDKVRISKYSEWYGKCATSNPKDTTGVITEVRKYVDFSYRVNWPEGHNSYKEGDLVLANRHKHADVIIAWAEGAVIETATKQRADRDDWCVTDSPIWCSSQMYRVKANKTEAELEREAISKEMAKLKERLDKLPVN